VPGNIELVWQAGCLMPDFKTIVETIHLVIAAREAGREMGPCVGSADCSCNNLLAYKMRLARWTGFSDLLDAIRNNGYPLEADVGLCPCIEIAQTVGSRRSMGPVQFRSPC
jgi:hypothetical protein